MSNIQDLMSNSKQIPSIDDIVKQQITDAFVKTCQGRQMTNLVFGLVKKRVDNEIDKLLKGYEIMDTLQVIATKKHEGVDKKKKLNDMTNKLYKPYQKDHRQKKMIVNFGNIMMEYKGNISDKGELNGNGHMKMLDQDDDEMPFKNWNTYDNNKILVEFKGKFKQNKFDGYGEATWKCWKNGGIEYEVYKGFWQESQMRGHGEFTTSKTNYSGFFQNNMRHGFGKLITMDGMTLEGMWDENWCATPPKKDKKGKNELMVATWKKDGKNLFYQVVENE